ncbi:MAG: SOS response-associated peptidase [Fimbriimonas sp.]
MCARFSLIAPHELLAEIFDVEIDFELLPRANIAPTQPVVIIREQEGKRESAQATWGLIPFWADSPSVATRMINARSESALEKGAFKHAMAKRRCLIPTSGFFEWDTEYPESPALSLFDDAPAPKGKPIKQPYLFRSPDRRPFAMAGLWERWKSPEGTTRETCTILTTTPNRLLAQIHDRMPCLLTPDLFEDWLSPETPKEAAHQMLTPAPEDAMIQLKVSREMNSALVDNLDLLKNLDQPT